MKKILLWWKVKDWFVKRIGLTPFYSYYVCNSRMDEFNGHWEPVKHIEDVPNGYPLEQVRRHVKKYPPSLYFYD